MRPSDIAALSYQHLQHALSLTRFLIAAEVFARNNNEVALAGWQSEYTLRQHAARVNIQIHAGQGTGALPMVVIPDAWLDFRFPRTPTPRRPVLVEIDRGSEQQKHFKRHVSARMTFIKPNGEYSRMFGTNLVTVAYATTAGWKRLRNMLAWTEEVLVEQGKQNYADVFRFTSVAENGEIDEAALFQAASWYQPFRKQPVSLLG